MIALAFYFMILGPEMEKARESLAFNSYAECQDAKVYYASDSYGTLVMSECYAR